VVGEHPTKVMIRLQVIAVDASQPPDIGVDERMHPTWPCIYVASALRDSNAFLSQLKQVLIANCMSCRIDYNETFNLQTSEFVN